MTSASPASVHGVVLAGGTSSRLGQPKQLLDVGGEPLLNHVLRAAAMSALESVVLVLGHDADRIAGEIGDFGQATIVNRRYAEGQSTSLQAGIAALPDDTAAALVLLGDQPLITPTLIDRMIERFRLAASYQGFVQCQYQGVTAPPAVIGRGWYPAVKGITGDQGARDLMRANPTHVVTVEADIPRPDDIDTIDDYRALLTRWGR